MAAQPCIECGTPALARRCPECNATNQQRIDTTRGGTTARGYGTAWQRLSARVIAASPHCAVCGSVNDLTVDHKVPKVEGGTDDLDNLEVMCRYHNGEKGVIDRDRAAKGGAGPPTLPLMTHRRSRVPVTLDPASRVER